MEQHPIPQQISSYEFKLVGEMTLSQFAKAAGGIVAAFLINATGIIFFLRWPLILLFGGGGLILAFVPINDRPAEVWVRAFLKSIYSPTIYIYKKAINKNWLDWQRKEVGEDLIVEEMTIATGGTNRVGDFIDSMRAKKIKTGQEEGVKSKKAKIKTKKGGVEEKTKIGPEKAVVEEELVMAEDWRNKKSELDLKRQSLEATGEAVFGVIPMPKISKVPNVIVGMVTDSQGKIVEEAIVEIQDEKGNPSRVLKTNSLGQFRSSTPLANGKYLIITEKEGENFDRVNVNLRGEIVEPVKIKAVA